MTNSPIFLLIPSSFLLLLFIILLLFNLHTNAVGHGPPCYGGDGDSYHGPHFGSQVLNGGPSGLVTGSHVHCDRGIAMPSSLPTPPPPCQLPTLFTYPPSKGHHTSAQHSPHPSHWRPSAPPPLRQPATHPALPTAAAPPGLHVFRLCPLFTVHDLHQPAFQLPRRRVHPVVCMSPGFVHGYMYCDVHCP